MTQAQQTLVDFLESFKEGLPAEQVKQIQSFIDDKELLESRWHLQLVNWHPLMAEYDCTIECTFSEGRESSYYFYLKIK